jgi:hypothetical protein
MNDGTYEYPVPFLFRFDNNFEAHCEFESVETHTSAAALALIPG